VFKAYFVLEFNENKIKQEQRQRGIIRPSILVYILKINRIKMLTWIVTLYHNIINKILMQNLQRCQEKKKSKYC
jgi:hypothetical protein